jgi:hypothetical protein
MNAKEVIEKYVELYPGTLVTPTIAKAFADAKFGAVGVSTAAIREKMREELKPFARGVFIAVRPLAWPQGQLSL